MNRTMKFGMVFMLAACLLSLTAQCAMAAAQADEKMFEGKTLKVGMFVPLTGTAADKGKRMVDACQLAADEINAAGGIYGAQIEIVAEDDEGVPASAVNAVMKLVTSDNVNVLLGSNPSSCSIAGMSIAAQYGVPQVVANSSSPKIGSADGNEYIFQTIPSDAIQSAFMVRFIMDKTGYTKIAIVHSNDDYGIGGGDGAEYQLKLQDLEPLVREWYSGGDKDFSPQISKVKDSGAEAVIFFGQGTEAALFRTQMNEQGLSGIPMLGAGGITVTAFELAGDNGIGTYAVATLVLAKGGERIQNFIQAFQDKYGYAADNTCAQAYDGLYMIADSAKRAQNLEPQAIRDAIETTGFDGICGVIKFDENHQVPTKSLFMLQKQQGKGEWVLVE